MTRQKNEGTKELLSKTWTMYAGREDKKSEDSYSSQVVFCQPRPDFVTDSFLPPFLTSNKSFSLLYSTTWLTVFVTPNIRENKSLSPHSYNGLKCVVFNVYRISKPTILGLEWKLNN